MKLDESIELKNKKLNIKDMKKSDLLNQIKLKESYDTMNIEQPGDGANALARNQAYENYSLEEIRGFMSEAMNDPNVGECLKEVLTMEGFLPDQDQMNEADLGIDEAYSALVEDDDIMQEMYESVLNNKSECGNQVNELWGGLGSMFKGAAKGVGNAAKSAGQAGQRSTKCWSRHSK